MMHLIRGTTEYKTIASILGPLQRTIEKHAENMRKKINVSSKEEMIEKFNIFLDR